MDAKMQALLDQVKPYVQQHPCFDLVQTKFGLIAVYEPNSSDGYSEPIRNYETLRNLLFREISGDVREESGMEHFNVILYPEEAEETARRVFPYLVDEDDFDALRQYLAEAMRRLY